MANTMNAASLFLINTLFDLYLFVLVLRILLVYSGVNYFDPITQFVVKLTDFIVKPLRRLLPTVRGFELASIILVLVLQMIKFLLVSLLSMGMPGILGLLILAIGDSIKIVLLTFFYAILLQAILSWAQPYSPVTRTLYQVTSPIMRPFQRLIPLINGIDISPIPALIVLQLLIILLVNPIMSLGLGIAFG
ncbi:MAG: YggT family protein [Gammaproteobacteria bacterium]|nr:MAG: YggT family protein [Gammaproteobacteria bacterium]